MRLIIKNIKWLNECQAMIWGALDDCKQYRAEAKSVLIQTCRLHGDTHYYARERAKDLQRYDRERVRLQRMLKDIKRYIKLWDKVHYPKPRVSVTWPGKKKESK